jgi:general secretion pathway protein E
MTITIPPAPTETAFIEPDHWLSSKILQDGVQIVPYAFAKKHRLIPFIVENTCISVAVSDPYCFEALEDIGFKTKKRVESVVKSLEEIEQAIEICYRKDNLLNPETKQQHVQKSLGENYDLLEDRPEGGVIRLCDRILLEAITQKASDIHFEPQENSLQVRYRVDGVLHPKNRVDKTQQNELVTRL